MQSGVHPQGAQRFPTRKMAAVARRGASGLPQPIALRDGNARGHRQSQQRTGVPDNPRSQTPTWCQAAPLLIPGVCQVREMRAHLALRMHVTQLRSDLVDGEPVANRI